MQTISRKNHEVIILDLLRHGGWVSGHTLTYDSKTTNLSARLLSLKHQGYLIESRASTTGSDFKEYRLVGKGKPPEDKRRQLVIKVPPSLSAKDIEDLEEAIKRLVAEFTDEASYSPFLSPLFAEEE